MKGYLPADSDLERQVSKVYVTNAELISRWPDEPVFRRISVDVSVILGQRPGPRLVCSIIYLDIFRSVFLV